MTFGIKILEWCGYPRWNNFENMFIRFEKIHERDRQTQKQTPHDRIDRAGIASRGKNCAERRLPFVLEIAIRLLNYISWLLKVEVIEW